MARRSKRTRDKDNSRSAPPQPVAEIRQAVAEPLQSTPNRAALRRHGLLILALWALALLAYSNSFRGGLVFDNYLAISQDPRIREVTAKNVQLILTQDYWYKTAVTALYRPLTTLSYLFNYAILHNGAQTAAYHGLNFLLHAANIALVYLLAFLLFKETWPAFAMAALWAVHPALTESVTNIVGRSDLLAAFGVLAGLLCYARSLAASGSRKVAWLSAIALATAAGMFSKESAIVVLAVVPLYDISFGKHASWRARIPGYLALVSPVLIYLLVRNRVLASLPSAVISFGDNPLVGAEFWAARMTAFKVLGKYLALVFWPAHLSCDYSYNQIPLFAWRFDNREEWKAILSLVVCILAAAAAVICYRRARPVFFFILFFFATMAPTANLLILIGAIMAERFLYLPSIGVAGCLVWVAWAAYKRLLPRWRLARRAAPAILALVCLALAARTYVRNLDWRDEESLWSSAVRVSPASYKAHQNRAKAYITSQGEASDGAISELEQALAILETLPEDRRVPTVYATAGLCYRVRGDMLAQSGDPSAASPRSNPWYQKSLDVLLRGKRVDRIWDQKMATRSRMEGKTIGPTGWPPLYIALGRVYLRLGEPRQALEALEFARRLRTEPEVFQELSAAHRALGEPDQAAISLMEGLVIDTSWTGLATQLAQLYRETAPQSCALGGNQGSNSLNLGCPLVHTHLCLASRNVANLYRQNLQSDQAAATQRAGIVSLGCPADLFQ